MRYRVGRGGSNTLVFFLGGIVTAMVVASVETVGRRHRKGEEPARTEEPACTSHIQTNNTQHTYER